MKTCGKCEIEKPSTEYRKRAGAVDGLRNHCKACQKAAEDAWRKKNQERVKANSKAWAAANPSKRQEILRKFSESRPGEAKIRAALYRKENREKTNASAARWSRENPGTRNAITARRRAAKLQRTPKWLTDEDFKNIRLFYELAKGMQIATGIPHHVDHIIPLQGELVSGLHCLLNLQILSDSENCSKHNKWSIDNQ